MKMADRRNMSVVLCIEGLPVNTVSSHASGANTVKTHFITDSEPLHQRLLELKSEHISTAMLDGPTGGFLARAPYHRTNSTSTSPQRFDSIPYHQ